MFSLSGKIAAVILVATLLETPELCASPPGAPSNPSPSNGATGVSINDDLDWADASGASLYALFFGTNPNFDSDDNMGASTSSNRSLSTLAYNTTYYWCPGSA